MTPRQTTKDGVPFDLGVGRVGRVCAHRTRHRSCARHQGFLRTRARSARRTDLGPTQLATRARSPSRRDGHLGPDAADGFRDAFRHAHGHHVGADPRCRGVGALLLRQLLRRRSPAGRHLRWRDDCVRRGNVRTRRQRQHADALYLLGAHHGVVVHARGLLSRPRHLAQIRDAGTARDHPRRTRDARRHHHARRTHRVVSAFRPGGAPAVERHLCRRRDRAGADRRRQQVRDRPVPLLAARRDGRADTCQRIPPRRGDGEGRHLPDRAVGSRLLRPHQLAGHDDRARLFHHAARRLALASRTRSQAHPRVRHCVAARLPRRVVRHGRRERRDGRAGDAGGARDVQSRTVHGRRHHRPLDRHTRHPQAGPPRPPSARPRPHRRHRGCEHGRVAVHHGVRRQGDRVRLDLGYRIAAALAGRDRRLRLVGGVDHHDGVHDAIPVGRVRSQGAPAPEPCRRTDASALGRVPDATRDPRGTRCRHRFPEPADRHRLRALRRDPAVVRPQDRASGHVARLRAAGGLLHHRHRRWRSTVHADPTSSGCAVPLPPATQRRPHLRRHAAHGRLSLAHTDPQHPARFAAHHAGRDHVHRDHPACHGAVPRCT